MKMTKNSTKRSLILSIMAMVLCVAMLAGTTFAWFTDSVTSSNNKIMSGSLVVDLELYDAETDTWNSIKNDKTALFNYNLWEPGYVDVKLLNVKNDGSLALKWKAMFISDEELSILADVIDVYVLPSATEPAMPGRDLAGYTKVGTLREFVNTIEETTYGTLEAGANAYLGIALKMQETAGNEYQNLELGSFDISIVATQYTAEDDSFDNQYDAAAKYDVASKYAPIPDDAAAPITLKTSFVEATLPAALQNALPAGVTAVRIAHDEPAMVDDRLVFNSVEIIDQNGNVIDLEALGNSVEIDMEFLVGDAFEVSTVSVYHDGAHLTDATIVDGVVSYKTVHLCQIVITEKVTATVTYVDGTTRKFDTLTAALATVRNDDDVITVYYDITESMSTLRGRIVCGKEGGVVIKNTYDADWLYCAYDFNIGEGVTYDFSNGWIFLYAGDCVVNGNLTVNAYYQRYAYTHLTINAPGSMRVLSETFILRLTDGDSDAGIIINGDNNDETVELQAVAICFYQGLISAKDATIKTAAYWQTNDTDGQGSANLVLDNSKLYATVNEHTTMATGNSTVTLKNGSVLDIAGNYVGVEINVDETSVVKKGR